MFPWRHITKTPFSREVIQLYWAVSVHFFLNYTKFDVDEVFITIEPSIFEH